MSKREKMKIVIIDDETKARSLLKNVISRLQDDLYHVFEAEDLSSGVALIKREQPKLVFLDIEMPNEQGTEILNYFEPDEINFEIVFSTAYSEYALRAFEMNAIDYILKPIRPKKVIDVIKRVKQSYNQEVIQEKLAELKYSFANSAFEKLGIPVKDGIRFVPLKDIVHLEADGMYTRIHLVDETMIMVSKPLKFFNHILASGKTFYRPHRSHIFNFQYLKQYVKRDGNYALLENEHVIPIAKDKRDEFVSLISAI
jgi:two-component system LytT family response regulator